MIWQLRVVQSMVLNCAAYESVAIGGSTIDMGVCQWSNQMYLILQLLGARAGVPLELSI